MWFRNKEKESGLEPARLSLHWVWGIFFLFNILSSWLFLWARIPMNHI